MKKIMFLAMALLFSFGGTCHAQIFWPEYDQFVSGFVDDQFDDWFDLLTVSGTINLALHSNRDSTGATYLVSKAWDDEPFTTYATVTFPPYNSTIFPPPFSFSDWVCDAAPVPPNGLPATRTLV